MLYYMPLEPYKERYSAQWSAPGTGWLERNWRKLSLPYRRIDGDAGDHVRTIKTGSVLDAVGRSVYCFSQVRKLLYLMESGVLTHRDTIYFDDFWHPGIEAIPYAYQQMKDSAGGSIPKMYAFLHAQSVDEFDFTYPMRWWMRHFEKGIGEILEGIFVCGPCLRDLVVHGGIAPKEKVFITGHPFSSEEVLTRMPDWFLLEQVTSTQHRRTRKDQVVFSSRWDPEKNPGFFLEVAKQAIDKSIVQGRTPPVFVICTGAPKLRSRDPGLLDQLQRVMSLYPKNIILKEGLTKEQYYEVLCESKVQMNTADQDFVAITLLESSTAGCYPVYPYFRSFPETFLHKPDFMYERLDVASAMSLLTKILRRDDLWTHEAIDSRRWIHERFDRSWLRMLYVMKQIPGDINDDDPYKED